ncbi:MAG: PLDc N-terminal domain-containing protein [Actinomycetota bacterium]|jgi:cell division protein FtsX|nr:PLDc N-terminal domain-containing protein [Actinomycetota bacterium]
MQPGSVDIRSLVIALIFGVPLVALWAIALVDVFQRADWEFPSQQSGSNDRLFWTLLVLLLNGIGATVYFLKVMRPYPRQHR